MKTKSTFPARGEIVYIKTVPACNGLFDNHLISACNGLFDNHLISACNGLFDNHLIHVAATLKQSRYSGILNSLCVMGSLRQCSTMNEIKKICIVQVDNCDATESKRTVTKGMELVSYRQKLIKFDDSSKQGWHTVHEYEQHALASD